MRRYARWGTKLLERKYLPYSLARIAKRIPAPIVQASKDAELGARLGEGAVGAALQQVSDAEFSAQEWGALLECQAIIARLRNREEKIRINYRGPATEDLRRGVNEVPTNWWANRFSIPPGYRVLLFSLVRHLKPKACLELGTVAGFPGLYIAQGLVLNDWGTLHTIEEDENSYAVGRETLWSLRDRALTHLGLFDDVLNGLLPEVRPLDFAYIDAAHSGKDEAEHAEKLADHLAPGSVVAYGNVHWNSGMATAWESIRSRPEVEVSLDLGALALVRIRNDWIGASRPRSEMTVEREAVSTRTPDERAPAFDFTGSARPRFAPRRARRGGVQAENLIWIFGSPRSGTTWLRDMLREVEDCEAWEEPFVGDLFGRFYYEHAQEGQLKARNFIMGKPVRQAWIRGIRQFVLEVSEGRFPRLDATKKVVIKEPNGSVGAPLLMEAFPESRMVLLVRDPRDVAASFLDASRKGAWLYERRSRGWIKESGYADSDPETFVKLIAEEYMQHVGNAKKAYDAHHQGRRVLALYEDLVFDPLVTLRYICSGIGIEVDSGSLEDVVEGHAWENVPEEKKGEGKFYRKASPGGWREDLTPDQVKIVERITAPLLSEFYPSKAEEPTNDSP